MIDSNDFVDKYRKIFGCKNPKDKICFCDICKELERAYEYLVNEITRGIKELTDTKEEKE